MLNALADILKVVISPESDWGKFSQKIVGLVVTAILGVTIWNVFFNYRFVRHRFGEISVGEVVERKPALKQILRKILERIKSNNPEIVSVWLYSWPDASQLIPVEYVGSSRNPIPLGSFREGDEYPVGAFVLRGCAEIERPANNLSCSVNGFEDAWGVIVVVYPEEYEPTEDDRRSIQVAARRVGLLLYSNQAHVGTID